MFEKFIAERVHGYSIYDQIDIPTAYWGPVVRALEDSLESVRAATDFAELEYALDQNLRRHEACGFPAVKAAIAEMLQRFLAWLRETMLVEDVIAFIGV